MEAFAVQYMSEEEKATLANAKGVQHRKQGISSTPASDEPTIYEFPAQERQALHVKPRVGFSHNCYKGGLGMFFQKTIKNTLIEKLLTKAWEGMVKYRCSGNAKAYRIGLKEPEKVFIYDDPLFNILNSSMKDVVEDWCTDNDGKRKRPLVNKATDIILTIAFEDVYYRGLLKRILSDIVYKLAEQPELLDLTQDEERIDRTFNHYKEYHLDRKWRTEAFWKWLEHEDKLKKEQEGIK